MIRPNTTNSDNTYLTQSEAAGYLRLSPRTLERWRVEGTGPRYRKFGRRIVYALKDLEEWADHCARENTSIPDRG